MKTRNLLFILITLLVLILTACCADDPVEEVEESFLPLYTEVETGEMAYPAEEAAYPSGEGIIPVEEAAYPITEADLDWLLQTWQLTAYAENGVDQAPPDKTLTFNADGSYSITINSEEITGTWTTILMAVESTLILTDNAGETQHYQIIELAENELNLQTLRDNLQIEEGYRPAD